MADYYFDTETYTKTLKPDLKNDKILTIQYQQIDSGTGEKKDELKILRAWESSEKNILQEFHSIFSPEDSWKFVPIGTNLSFDFFSLLYRWRENGIEVPPKTLFYEHPSMDIKSILVIFNRGVFKGANLEKFTGKKYKGAIVSEWYEQKDYASIQKYIEDEAEGFINLYQCLVHKLPNIWFEYAKEKGIMI
jgi:hypothetical protein